MKLIIGKSNSKYLGSYKTVEEAEKAYRQAKESYIQEVATSYYKQGKITKHVYNALMNFRVKII